MSYDSEYPSKKSWTSNLYILLLFYFFLSRSFLYLPSSLSSFIFLSYLSFSFPHLYTPKMRYTSTIKGWHFYISLVSRATFLLRQSLELSPRKIYWILILHDNWSRYKQEHVEWTSRTLTRQKQYMNKSSNEWRYSKTWIVMNREREKMIYLREKMSQLAYWPMFKNNSLFSLIAHIIRRQL